MANENFLPPNYTEEDPTGAIAVDTNIITMTLLDNQIAYVYKDANINHFSEDFTHQFEGRADFTVDTSWWFPYLLSNSISEFRAIQTDGNGVAVGPRFRRDVGVGQQIIQFILEDPATVSDVMPNAVAGTLYFFTIDRDDDAGVNSKGLYTLYVRTGSHTGTLVDTLVLSVSAGGSKIDFRYVYGVCAINQSGFPNGLSGISQNLNLNEAVAAFAVLQEYFQENFQAIGNN